MKNVKIRKLLNLKTVKIRKLLNLKTVKIRKLLNLKTVKIRKLLGFRSRASLPIAIAPTPCGFHFSIFVSM